jgi:hypothetical protein
VGAYLGHKVLVYWRPSADLGLLPDNSHGIRLGIMRIHPDGASPGRYVVDHRHDVSLRRSNMLMRYEVLPSPPWDSAREAHVIEIKVDMLLTPVAESIRQAYERGSASFRSFVCAFEWPTDVCLFSVAF